MKNVMIVLSLVLVSSCKAPDVPVPEPQSDSTDIMRTDTLSEDDPAIEAELQDNEREEEFSSMEKVEKHQLPPFMGKFPKENEYSYQLSKISEGGSIIYDVEKEIHAEKSTRMVAFLSVDLLSGSGKVFVNVLENFQPIYTANASGSVEFGAHSLLHTELKNIEEVKYAGGPLHDFRGTMDLTRDGNFSVRRVLQRPPLYLVSIFGDAMEETIATYFDLTSKNIQKDGTLVIRSKSGRTFECKPSTDSIFSTRNVKPQMNTQYEAFHFYPQQTPWKEELSVYKAKTNDLNMISGDDIYFFEPAIYSDSDASKLIISIRVVKNFLQKEFTKLALIYKDLLILQGIRSVRLCPDTDASTCTPLREFDSENGEIEWDLESEEILGTQGLDVQFLNEKGSILFHKTVDFKVSPQRRKL